MLIQFQFHVKINSQIYSNHIPFDFEPMITHQSSRILRLLMNRVLFLDKISIRYLISIKVLKDIFQHLKNQ